MGTKTEGNQAAAKSPVMAGASKNRRYCKERLWLSPLASEATT